MDIKINIILSLVSLHSTKKFISLYSRLSHWTDLR